MAQYLYNGRTTHMVENPIATKGIHHEMNHGSDKVWTVEPLEGILLTDDDGPQASYPQSQFISEGNGGEMRKSYHGYPQGYAQLIQSPDTFTPFPMQIDTWNRQMNNATYIDGGPLPRSSRIRNGIAGYNPLLECPCSDRLVKQWGMTYTTDPNSCHGDKDSQRLQNDTECYMAATQLIPSYNNVTQKTSHDPSQPAGCTVSMDQNGSLLIEWNSYHNDHNTVHRDNGHDENAIIETPPLATSSSSGQALYQHQPKIVGVANGVVNVTIMMNPNDSTVTITLTGPNDKWFGVGFGADSMCVKMTADECPAGGPYAIIVKGDDIEERRLDYHGMGRTIDPSVIVTRNMVDGAMRSVSLTRALVGISDQHFTFDVSMEELKLIMANGCSLKFAQHCSHQSNSVTFLSVDMKKTVCRAGIQGTIDGSPFQNHCEPFPKSVLLDEKNPTCSIETYQGGLSCCRHNHFLLDKDQDIPWDDQVLEYRLKFRFYFEEFKEKGDGQAASHQNLVRLYWMTEAWAGEYDVPQCEAGTPPADCIHTITSRWQVRECVDSNEDTAGVELIYAAPHCHAPTCLSMELYNADTGQLLCHVDTLKGSGSTEEYDEKGYIAIPPCLWSSNGSTDDLPAPHFLPLNATLLSIKRANSTWPHTGEMASWQMRGILVSRNATVDKSQWTAPSHLRSSGSQDN